MIHFHMKYMAYLTIPMQNMYKDALNYGIFKECDKRETFCMQSKRAHFQHFFHCVNTSYFCVFKYILVQKDILSSFKEKIGPLFTYISKGLRNIILIV